MTDSMTPRTVNAERSQRLRAYIQEVGRLMSARYGIGYSDIKDDVDVGYAKIQAAFGDGLSPASFAEKLGDEVGLRPASPGFGAELAREHNKRQAALVAYAETTPGWTVGADGIYAQAEAGVARIAPDHDSKGARWKFAISAADNSTLAGNGDPRPHAESFGLELVTSQQDIGDAWNHFLELRPEYANIDPEQEKTSALRI